MHKIPEKRKHVRIERQCITNFRIKPYEDVVSTDWDMVVLVNLSDSGTMFYNKENLDVGTILDFKIDLSPYDSSVICVGKIVRKKRHMENSIIGYAIEFTEINEQIKEVIKKISMPSNKKWDNCKLFNTDDCPNFKDGFMKRFICDSSIGRRYLPTYDKRRETEINNRFAHNCDSFKPFNPFNTNIIRYSVDT